MLVDGGRIDGGDGASIANAGDDLHSRWQPRAAGADRRVRVITPDGRRHLARVERDPLP